MPIWKLNPINLQAEDWKRSTYKGDAIIRAKDEDEARDVAACHFDHAALITTPKTLLSPWPNPALVRCVQLESNGPSTVLDPAD
jgi:hypothetical protein